MRRFIIGTLALFATLLLAYFMEGGNPIDLFLPSPLIIVVCVPFFAALAVWSFKDWGRAWKDAFNIGSESSAPTSAAVSSARLWDFYEKACYISGIVGFILGLTIIGKNVDADLAKLGPYVAVDCASPILAIFLAMVARILKARVERSQG
jgi:Flagellar motor component